MFEVDPFGRFACRSTRDGDYLIQLGAAGAAFVAHGSGWNIYLGPAPSPVPPATAANAIGPAMAAILAVVEAFKSDLSSVPEVLVLNALDWHHRFVPPSRAEPAAEPDCGEIWAIGTGSVGTAILYFLAMATRRFLATLFDMDVVQIHTLDRSPIFVAGDVGVLKVHATSLWLQAAGVTSVRSDPCALDESNLWRDREAGTPDILIAAANERNVRAVIETGFPPIQIYGTTGKNWQAAVIRHIPLTDPCSSCLFPETDYAPTQCATGEVAVGPDSERIDAALPFLSFAAGAMAAAEILKLGLPGYPFAPNRVVLNTQPAIRTLRAALSLRPHCICQRRSTTVRRQMMHGSRFSAHGLGGAAIVRS